MSTEFDSRMSDALEGPDYKEIRAAMHDAKAGLEAKQYQYFLAKTMMLLFPSRNVDLIRTIAEQDRDALNWVTPWHLTQDLSRDVLETVVDLGWDINTRNDDVGSGSRESLLQEVCNDEDLVRWCLDHGASVQDDATLDPHLSPPLLECVAGHGTVATFKLLHSRGAQLGERTLHTAVRTAAARSDSPQKRAGRMDMVKYLVEDLKLDVNAMDTKEVRHRHPGPPLSYAVTAQDPDEAIQYLLKQGANPTIKDCWGEQDAISLAEKDEKPKLAQLLREHSAKRTQN